MNRLSKHNYFTLTRKYFLQRRGTAMGTKFAPSYVYIFMAVLKKVFEMIDKINENCLREISG